MDTFLHLLSVVLPFIAILMAVVFIHELGHFLVARWCGVAIQAFSIGFGREIWGFDDRHGTRWKLCWIPLGGYVRFIDDETAASTSSPEALDKLTPEQRKGAFRNQPLLNRALVVAAGPAFNLISAVLVYVVTFWLFGTYSTAAIVDDVNPGSPAAVAGLKAGDRITAIARKPIETFSELQRIVSQSADVPLAFEVERDGKLLSLTITPQLAERTDPLGGKAKVAVIGILRKGGEGRWEHKTHGLIESTALAVNETADVSWQIIQSIPKLPGAILRTYSGKRQSEIGGPGAMAEMTAQAVKGGIGSIMRWVAILSIMLGIMNLMPIPILDGGHLLFYAIEAVRGQPLNEQNQEIGFRIGLAILATMMIAANLNDVMRWLGIG